ncbi:MAG: hypothetical protein RIS28_471, partial [Bacteroidota bacterium]
SVVRQAIVRIGIATSLLPILRGGEYGVMVMELR